MRTDVRRRIGLVEKLECTFHLGGRLAQLFFVGQSPGSFIVGLLMPRARGAWSNAEKPRVQLP